MVYGAGAVEGFLGEVLPDEARIVTKVPATRKPLLDDSRGIAEFYPESWIYEQVQGSLARLRRCAVETLLLHNWSRRWTGAESGPFEVLLSLKTKGVVRRIGISLPDHFEGALPEGILAAIDVVEAPLNPDNTWIVNSLTKLRQSGIEVLLRSLFLQGSRLSERPGDSPGKAPSLAYVASRKPSSTACAILTDAARLNQSLVVGMTTEEQISENISCLSKERIP